MDAPEHLERVPLSCLAKEPEDRPESAAALSAALLDCDAAGERAEDDATQWWRNRRNSG